MASNAKIILSGDDKLPHSDEIRAEFSNGDPVKKIVLTFGLISGAIMAGMFVLTIPFKEQIGFDNGMVIGYTSMVIAGLLIFFGVKQYRDTVGGGVVTFGRAFLVGMLISTVASSVYVATWEVIFYGTDVGTEYMAGYREHMIGKERAAGASEAQVAAKDAELQKWGEMYKNPLVNVAMTFLEPLPVGLVLALISAGLLRRRYAATEMAPRIAT